jgi:hypothetical protein
MAETSFRVDGKLTFDVSRGTATGHGHEAMVVFPATALEALLARIPPGDGRQVLSEVGAAIGKRAADSLGGTAAVRRSPLESVVAELGAQFAAAGLGLLSIERWGRAMVLTLEHASLGGGSITALLEGAFCAATDSRGECVLLSEQGGAKRALFTSSRAAAQAREWVREGVAFGEVLSRLQSKGVS